MRRFFSLVCLCAALFHASATQAACSWSSTSLNSANYEESILAEGGYVAVSKSGELTLTGDGVDWKVHSRKQPFNAADVDWSKQIFVSAGNNSSGASWGPWVLTTTDGVTWSNRLIPSSYPMYDQLIHGGKFVVTGLWGSSFTSDDGMTWSSTVNTLRGHNVGAASDGTKIVAMGNPANANHSSDGLNWSTKTIINGRVEDLAWNGYEFIGVGALGKVYQSFDGVTWAVEEIVDQPPMLRVAWNGNEFVAVGIKSAQRIFFRSNCNAASYPAIDAAKAATAATGGGLFRFDLALLLAAGSLLRRRKPALLQVLSRH